MFFLQRGLSHFMRIVPVLLILLFANTAHALEPDHGADEHHASSAQQSAALQLSPEIQQLLQREMQQIRSGMETLVFAMASADWQQIEKTAANIQQGYIMKQTLSVEQKHQLHQALPQTFKTLDQRFHYYAGMLSHVARERDMELANFFIYKMNESCSACHSQYAVARFPGFGQPNKHKGH